MVRLQMAERLHIKLAEWDAMAWADIQDYLTLWRAEADAEEALRPKS